MLEQRIIVNLPGVQEGKFIGKFMPLAISTKHGVGSLNTAYLWCVWVDIKAQGWFCGRPRGHINCRRYVTGVK